MKKNAKNPLVSVVVPVFNAEKFLKETINSVKSQTYDNWELILVNDCSTDKSADIIKLAAKTDNRIKLVNLEKNGGAAKARNLGIMEAKGKYLAYIDSDDLWLPEKLEKQIEFMQKTDSTFCYTGYEFADENAKSTGKIVSVPEKITYKQALRNTTIFTSTVMFNLEKLDKESILMPDVKSEDTATWWKILKKINHADGLNENLSIYRRSKNTLSSDKKEAIKRIWNLYRKQENLNLVKSSVNFAGYAINAVRRRV